MKNLILVTGATASGKTDYAIRLAQELGCEIISADSRQVYRDIPIGTAQPTPEQLQAAPHHFIGFLGLEEYYSAALFEEQVMKLLPSLWAKNDNVIVSGGSMMYLDAIMGKLDELPTISPEIRHKVMDFFTRNGAEATLDWLRQLDPEYYRKVDRQNLRRVIHAIEICLQSDQTYTSLRTGVTKKREFNITTHLIQRPRPELFQRINDRVDKMIAAGLEEEAMRLYSRRHLNSLNTVGYKEIFAMHDGLLDRDTAISRIKKNTRVYAKKQLLWLSKLSSDKLITREI